MMNPETGGFFTKKEKEKTKKSLTSLIDSTIKDKEEKAKGEFKQYHPQLETTIRLLLTLRLAFESNSNIQLADTEWDRVTDLLHNAGFLIVAKKNLADKKTADPEERELVYFESESIEKDKLALAIILVNSFKNK